MKNTSLIMAALLVTVVGGAGVYAFVNKDVSTEKSDSMVKEDVMMEKEPTSMVKAEDAMMKKDDSKIGDSNNAMMQKSGAYLSFTPETLVTTASTRQVLFFFANWCPTCASADKNFTQNLSEIPADVTLIKVNYNDTETDKTEKDLAEKYGVTYQHTFVQIDEQGNKVGIWNGGQIGELLSNLR